MSARSLLAPAEGSVETGRIPVLPLEAFRKDLLASCRDGGRLVALFAMRGGRRPRLAAAVLRGGQVRLSAAAVGSAYPSLTPGLPQAHLFERDLHERFGLRPVGHPWRKPVRRIGDGGPAFFRVEGPEIHEVAVGPVHAGVIEPGHFRFQCHGERVLHLEIALGYQHRGVLRALLGGPDRRTLHYMETLAGDTTVGHALAYAEAVEALSGTRPPPRAHAIRAASLELERLANHVGDLGALSADVGFLPAAAALGRLRGDFLNLTAEICGSRFGRALVRPGGVGFDVEPARVQRMRGRLRAAADEVGSALDVLFSSSSVLARFEGTGTVSRKDGQALSLAGPAARACGLDRDVRAERPTGAYRARRIRVARAEGGDVLARAAVRREEIGASAAYLDGILAALPAGACARGAEPPRPGRLAVSLVEGWRGEICHVAWTDRRGRFAGYEVFDPLFRNWFALAAAMRDGQISDFPLVNKSFNLSYCGHDL